MDGNNQPNSNSGFLSHILDPQLGQVFNTLVRSVLPHHEQNSQASGSASSAPSPSLQMANEPPSEHVASVQPDTIETGSVSRSDDANAHASSSAASRPVPEQTGFASSSAPFVSPAPSVPVSGTHDVEMASSEDSSASALNEPVSRPPSASRNTRRARVEEDEDEDYWRESNRQRMHSPTPHDDERHHFMPIPEDHGVPQSSQRSRSPSQPSADSSRNQSPEAQQPQGGVMWTFDIGPAPQPTQGNAQATEGAHPGHDHHHHAHGHGRHDQLPTLNFFINIPLTGAPMQPGAANIPDGTNGPANAGFPFMPFPFPLGQFGMDMVEERDDPERAKRLVDGLEEVPVGLVKRMERAGGPGTTQGETPTCAVCWESLLDPVGGGFEGNVELAREEAAQAAREDAASQQERESSMEVDGPEPTSPSASSSSPCAASSATASGSSGEGANPKIVVLPCSHVFHASCLLPWFSKPGRTTCPSCRFDIDPDSLTYRPRPVRARRPEPQAAPQPAPAAAPQPQQPPVYGPPPPPPSVPHLSQPSAAPAASAQAAPQPPHAAAAAPNANGQPAQGRNPEGQQLPSLPPFITFDISMIIPVFPGRPADPAQPANGAQPANSGAQPNPPPPRTDRNGFRLDDPILQEAVRSTFERIFGRPAPPPQGQPAPQPQPQQAAGAGAGPTENAPRDVPLDWYTFTGPLPGFPPVPPPNARRAAPSRPAPVRKWTLPPPPGPTLRQLVERNERELGLRCSDVSCGLGPSDDDPTTTFDTTALRQISIRPLKSDTSGREAVCEHKFHPSCLVSAERVAGWGGEDKKEERENEGEDVEVSCPVCRAVGVISRLDWEEGACALA